MVVNILIVDQSTTNRIMLAAQVQDSGFIQQTCAEPREAIELTHTHHFDALIVDAKSMAQPAYKLLCASLKHKKSVCIIATNVDARSQARIAALNCGADAILTAPIHRNLFGATLRRCLEQNAAEKDLIPQGEYAEILGFAEDGQVPFGHNGHIMWLSQDPTVTPSLERLTRAKVSMQTADTAPLASGISPPIDVVIIDHRAPSAPTNANLSQIMSKLKARDGNSRVMQLVIFDQGAEQIAAEALDMGADDVIIGSQSPAEIAHRAGRLLRRKQRAEAFRHKVRDGLRAALTDPLTGLANRRAALHRLIKLSQEEAAVAVLVVDLDHFKTVNDTHGHDVGDQVLRELAHRLEDNLGPESLVARIGGEEFLVARPVKDRAAAEMLALQTCAEIRNVPFSENDLTITASIGVALCETYLADQDSALHVLKCADKALYVSKAAGRDRASFAKTAA